MIDIENAKKELLKYVKSYDLNNGKIALKLAHIFRVSEISKNIATDLKLPQEDIEVAELIGLLHDIGRFEQVKNYNTFDDNKSINHGEYGVKVLFEDNLIKRFNIDEKYYEIIKLAILNHNRFKIEEGMSENQKLHCKIIRDSDKLDIFEVMLKEETINAYGCTSEELQNETFTEEIVKAFKEKRPESYSKNKTYGDWWIASIAYVFDFYFKNSYIVLKEKNYINDLYKNANFKNIKTDKEAKEIIKIANEYIEDQIGL